MRVDEFLADLQEGLPHLTWGTAKRFLLMLVFISCFIALLATTIHFLPFKEFEKYGYLGVFLANLISSAGVIISATWGIPVTVAVAAISVPFWAALVASIGSTLGEVTAYYVGYSGKKLLDLQRFRRYQTAERWMKRYGALAIFTSALLPIFIFDFVGIAAGVLRFPLRKFLLFCFLARLPRALIEVYFYMWIFEHVLTFLPRWMGIS